MINTAQIKLLEALDYKIEDMANEWGVDYKGCYRWINDRFDQAGEEGFGVIKNSIDDAWADAWQYQQQLDGIHA